MIELPKGPQDGVTFCTMYGPATENWATFGWAPGTVVLRVDFIPEQTPGFNRDSWRILLAVPK